MHLHSAIEKREDWSQIDAFVLRVQPLSLTAGRDMATIASLGH